MPELPEVETTKRGIEPHLLGKRIQAICVHQRSLRWPIPHAINQLEGQRITAVSRRAKYILVDTDAGTAIWHLGMSGSLRLVNKNEPRKLHDHVDWQLSGNKVLRYHDPRRFGALLFQPLGQEHERLQTLGVEPLSDDFDARYLHAHSRTRRQAVKTFIMNGNIVVGVGNIYANESLFAAGINPKLAAGKISLARYERLVDEIKRILANAIEQGGTTLRDFVGGDGKPGYFQQRLFVYGRAGLPCRVCATPLKEIRQGQRSTVYCSSCQR